MLYFRSILSPSPVVLQKRTFLETYCSVNLTSRRSTPQAQCFSLTNLKTHLIIRISKGQAIDGKRETKGRVYEDWLRARLEAGAA